jgi:xanthine/uracil permease
MATTQQQPAPAVPGERHPAGVPHSILRVPFDGTVGWLQHTAMTIQNVFAIVGMFLFPAVLSASLHLSPAATAELYGVTFVVGGLGTVLQAVLGLRMPIVLGPWAASLAGLIAAGKVAGLGTAFGSFFVAALIWALLSLPIPGFSAVGRIGRLFRHPLLFGGVVLIAMTTLTSVTVVNWIGSPGSPGFGAAAWVSGAVAIVVSFAILLLVRGPARSTAMLFGIVVGALVWALFRPISFARVGAAPWLLQPHLFGFGFHVNPALVVLFFLLLMTGVTNSLALYNVAAEWGGVELPGRRMSWGILGQSVATVVAAALGTFSVTVYPDNLAIVRTSRIGSRWITMSTGLLLLVGGFVLKFDEIFVSIPSNIIAAAAVVLFGVILASGLESLSRVKWDQLTLLVIGPPFMIAIGGLFVTEESTAHYPLIVKTIISQPLFTGPVLLFVLFVLVEKVIRPRRERADAAAAVAATPPAPAVAHSQG